MSINYHHLRYFWAAAREGSVTGASQKLNVSQPAVSSQIRQLEQTVGNKLFLRMGRRLTLTEAGQLVYRYADEIFGLGRELEEALEGGLTGRPIRLTVGIAMVVPKLVAYRVLEPALRLAEPVRIQGVEDQPERLLAELAVHKLDLVLADTPVGPPMRVRAYSHLLGECPVAIFGSATLVKAHRSNFPRSLEGAPMLLPTEISTLRRSLDAWFEAVGIRPRIVGEFDDSALLGVFGQAGTGLFPGPLVIQAEICRQYRVQRLGTLARATIYLTQHTIRPILSGMKHDAPDTLQQAITYFADPEAAHGFMVALRWPNGVICPHCAAVDVTFLVKRRVWQCKAKACRRQFSAKVGTIFEDSPLGLDKWLPCVWMIANCKNGISSYEVARGLGVTQKTAWFMLHRVRLAMQTPAFGKFGGNVEVDETFIGGKSRFMHQAKRERVITGTGGAGKVAVMGILEREGRKHHSRVRVSVVPNTRRRSLQPKIRENVQAGSSVFTDALLSYQGLEQDYIHGVIDHSVSYVKGKVHTNGLENFWSLLKRAIRGTYVSIEPFHIFRYLDEQAHRFNNRKDNDRGRFVDVLRGVVGKRLTYSALTGSQLPETS